MEMLMGQMRLNLGRLIVSTLLAAIASGVMWTSKATATDYYITQSGSGGGGGLTYANSDSVATFNAGAAPYNNLDADTVYLCGTITTAVVVPDSGTVGNVITIRGDYAADPGIISGACTNPGDNCAGIQLFTAAGTLGRDYITVDSVTVTNSNAMGIATKYTGSNITLKNCRVSGSKDGGIIATAAFLDESRTMTNITIENNIVTGCNSNYPTTDVHEAITIENVDTFTVKGNTSYSNYKEGLDLKNDAENGTVYGNHLYLNGTNCATCPNVYFDGSHDINFYQNSIHDCTTAQGILIGPETSDGANNNFDCSNINIYYNLIYSNTGHAMKVWTGGPADADQYVDDIDIYNNVFYDTDCILIDTSTHVGTTANNIKNNIFWTGSGVAVQDDSTSNIFVDNCGYNVFSTSVGTNECSGTGDVSTADVLFHTAGSNFHLQSTSPAIDKGATVSLTADYDGRTVPYDYTGTSNATGGAGEDIGACEWSPITGYGVNITGGGLY
jgi:hypothetical protein